MGLPSRKTSTPITSAAADARIETDTFWLGSEPDDGSNQESGAILFVCT